MKNFRQKSLGFVFQNKEAVTLREEEPANDEMDQAAVAALREAYQDGKTATSAEKQKLLALIETATENERVILAENLYGTEGDHGGFLDGAMSRLAVLGLVPMQDIGGRGGRALTELSSEAWETLARKACEDASKEGVVLTKTLLPLLNTAVWPSETRCGGEWQRIRSDRLEAFSTQSEIAPGVKNLAEWIKKEKDPTAVSKFVNSAPWTYWPLTTFILARTPVADGMLEIVASEDLLGLAMNPNLTAEGRGLIMDRYIASIDSRHGWVSELTEEVLGKDGWLFSREQMGKLAKIARRLGREVKRDNDTTWGARLGLGCLASLKQVVEDTKIITLLEESHCPEVLCSMPKNTKGEIWIRSLRRLQQAPWPYAHSKDGTIAGVLEETKDWQMEGVKSEDLLDLVEHTDQSIRLEGRRLMVATEAKQTQQTNRSTIRRM